MDETGGAEGQRSERTLRAVEELRSALTDVDAPSSAERERRAREELVLANVSVAESIARRYRNRHEAMEELVQCAYLGLVKAANGFVPDRAPDFLSYAVPTISGEVKRYFRDQGWAVRPPRRLQELNLSIARSRNRLENELGRSPTVAELAQDLDVDEDDVIEAVVGGQSYHAVSLDAPVGPDDGAGGDTLGDALPLEDESFTRVEDLVALRPLLDRLPPRERRILALRYFEELSQQQIGERVGVTQMQVSRLLSRTLGQLRAQLEADSDPDPGD